MPIVTKNTITWDEKDWLGGLHPQDGSGIPILFNGYDEMNGVDPFYNIGSITAGKQQVAVTNEGLVDGYIKNFVSNTSNSSLATTQLFGVGGSKVYEVDPFSGEVESDSDYPHAITDSTMEDVAVYNIDGVEGLLYSYNIAAGGDIGFQDDFDSTFDDDYWSVGLGMGVLNKEKPHPLIVGDDDLLYIGDGNVLKSIDGSGPTGNNNALTLPASYTIKSFSKLNNNTLVIFADQETNDAAGEAKAFFWDYLSKDFYRSYKLQGNEVGGAKEYKGSVCVVSKGLSADLRQRNRDIRFSVFDGSTFKVLFTVNDNAPIPSTGGIEVMNNYVLINIGGVIYSYQTPFDGIKAGHMNIITTTGSSSGVIKRSEDNHLLMSSSDTLEIITATAGFGTGQLKTSFAEPANSFLNKSRVIKIRVDFTQPFTGGRTLDLYLRDENANSIKVLDDIAEVTEGNLSKVYYSNTFTQEEFSFFNALQLYGDWNSGEGSTDAPVIRRVVVEYENVAITN